MQNFLFIVLAFAIVQSAAVLAARPTVRETTREIPTYALGPEDPNPPLLNAAVYPYPMQTNLSDTKATQKHRAVILENDYIRVIILPDLGGRIYAAHDKSNRDFDFIYHNHVIKPGLVAMRGAWLSGGIEWNFPTRGHTVNTVSPVKYRIITDRDSGAVSCVVGTTEWVRRMRWSVQITVPPDQSRFTYRVRLTNPTLTHNLAYFWANAAVHAWDDTRVTFPPAQFTFAGRRADPQPWPIRNGRDVSWYRNTPNPHDYFCASAGDYQGAYNHQRECGSVFCAGRYDSPGRKLWTWGTARSGAIWEQILTDSDGQYIEVQSGRLPTQGDTWIFEPHMAETWEETWYPVKNMAGLVKACPDAAVNVAVEEGKVLLAVNSTRAFKDASVEFIADGKTVVQDRLDLPPAGSWRKELPLEKPTRYKFILRDAQNREVISYEPASPEQIAPPQLEPQFPSDDKCSAEQLYLKGYYAQKHWNPQAAIALFEKALQADAGLTSALTALAQHYYRTAQYDRARQAADKALLRNDDDQTARYYRALANLRLGRDEPAREDLELISRRAAFRNVARYGLAALAIKRGDFAAAADLLFHVSAADQTNPIVMFAAVQRRRGDARTASGLAGVGTDDDPLNPLAAVEKALQGDESLLSVLRDDPQEYLEAACAYMQMNLFDDASAVLGLAEKRTAPHPFVFLYMSYLADRSGNRQAASELCRKALRLSPDYIFPFRLEDLAVLQSALRYAPDDWKPHYYTGLLLASWMRYDEAIEHFQAAARPSPDFAVLYWCLGEVLRQRLHDPAKAQAAYERALKCNPGDCTYYIVLDQLYADRGARDLREKLFATAPQALQRDYRFLLRKAMFLVDAGRFDEALAILKNTHFHPWEGWSGAHDVYVSALRGQAQQHIRNKRFEQAIDSLKQAMEYPENLGSGRPARVDYTYEHYHIGICCKSLKQSGLAREYLLKCTGSSGWREKAQEELKSLPD